MTYPNGRVLNDVYNPGLDTTIDRVSSLQDGNGTSPGTTLEAYTFLNLNSGNDCF